MIFTVRERLDLPDRERFSNGEPPDLHLLERSRMVQISNVRRSGGPKLLIRHVRRQRRAWVQVRGGSEVRGLGGPKVRRCTVYDDSRANHRLEGGRSVATCVRAPLSCCIVYVNCVLCRFNACFSICCVWLFRFACGLLAAMWTTALSTSLLVLLAVACDAHSLLSEQ